MLFIQLLTTKPIVYVMWVSLIIFSIWLHETVHALVACSQGDNTALRSGYLFNPIKQMGLTSIIALLLVGIAWGGVPVNYMNMKRHYSPAITALAGPVTNLVLFLVFCCIGTIVFKKVDGNINSYLFQLFYVGGILNFVLFLFNLIPVPPLDGWVILITLFPKITRINQELRNGIIFAVFALLFFSFSQIFILGQYAVFYTMKTLSILAKGFSFF